MPLPRNFCPVAAGRQQQPARHTHRPVGHQAPPQLRRRLPQRLQQIRREPQQPRRQKMPGLGRQSAVQGPRRHHQHRRAGHRVPQGAAGVQQGCQGGGPSAHAHPYAHQLTPQAMACRRPEHHGQNQVRRPGGDQQHFGGDVGIEDASHHRHAASRQQAQPQHASGHCTGNGKQQQRQPPQPLLGAEGDDRQDHPRRQLHRQRSQKTAPRQEHRHGVGPAQGGRQGVAPPAQGHSRQPPGAKEQQIVHQGVEHKHAVHINRRHGAAPLHRHGPYYRTAPPGKAVAKRRRVRFPRTRLFVPRNCRFVPSEKPQQQEGPAPDLHRVGPVPLQALQAGGLPRLYRGLQHHVPTLIQQPQLR